MFSVGGNRESVSILPLPPDPKPLAQGWETSSPYHTLDFQRKSKCEHGERLLFSFVYCFAWHKLQRFLWKSVSCCTCGWMNVWECVYDTVCGVTAASNGILLLLLLSRSVVSDSVRPHRRQPPRLSHPWDSPGKNTGVGCHFLLQCMKVKGESEVAQSCLTLSDPIDSSPPGSPVPGMLQARTLERVAISFSNAWKWKVKVKLLSRFRLFATPWTTAYQAPPPMGFSRQEYWSGLPLPSLL